MQPPQNPQSSPHESLKPPSSKGGNQFEVIVERAPDIVALVDQKGTIRYVNSRTELVLGYTPHAVEGRNISEFLHREDVSRASEYSKTIRENAAAIPTVLRVKNVSGGWVPFEIVANNRLRDPEVRAIIFSARDIRFRDQLQHINIDTTTAAADQVGTLSRINAELRNENQARRQAEMRLEHTISLLNATLNSTADGILVVSTEGKVISCNGKFMEMWGLNCASTADGEDRLLLAAVEDQLRDPNEFLEKVQALYSNPSATSFDVIHFKDGRIFERYSQPQQVGSRIVGRVWSFRDVTRARNVELELAQAQKMEALGRLAGGIAHDFNNLLMLITGYASQLLDNPTMADGRAISQQILSITRRAASVTRQLLAFSRKLPETPVNADFSVIVSGIEPLLRQFLSDQVRLRLSSSTSTLPVHVDVSQIELMIMNLAINAQDAMVDGGILSLQLDREIRMEAAGTREYAVLHVSDTGHGMPPEVVEHIFEPFFTTKDLGKGTGLGLSTVLGIVERSGGSIKVESEPNQGTTFRIYIPLVTGVPIVHSSVSVEPVRGGNETILLAEDEVGIRTMTRTFLEGLGYRVIEARDGKEAVRRSRKFQDVIHLIVTDILMPGIRGDDAVRLIRKGRPEALAIYISGYHQQDETRSELDNILYKPFEFPELGRKIRSLLDANTIRQEGRKLA